MSTLSVNQQDSSQTTINITDTLTVANVEGSLTLQGNTILPNLSTQTIETNGFLIVKEKCTFNNPVNFGSALNLLNGFNQYVYFSNVGSISFVSSGPANSSSTALFNSSLATVSALSYNLQQSLVNYINLAPYVASDGTVTDLIPLTTLTNIGGPYSTTLFTSIHYAPLAIDVTNGGSITNQNIGNYFLNGVMYTFINTHYENLVLQFPSGTFGGLYDSNGNTINSQVIITILGNGGTFKFFTLQNTIYIVSLSPGSTYYGTYVNVQVNTGSPVALFVAALFELIVTSLNNTFGTIIQPYQIQTLTNIVYKVVAGIDNAIKFISDPLTYFITHIPVVGPVFQNINNFITNTMTTVIQYGVNQIFSINWPPQIDAAFKQAFASLSQEMIVAGGTEFQVAVPSQRYAVSVVVTIHQNKNYLQYLQLQQLKLLIQEQINQQKQIQHEYAVQIQQIIQEIIKKLAEKVANKAAEKIRSVLSEKLNTLWNNITGSGQIPTNASQLGTEVAQAAAGAETAVADVQPEVQTLVDTVATQGPAIEASIAQEASLIEQLATIAEQVITTISEVASQVSEFLSSLSEIIDIVVTIINTINAIIDLIRIPLL